MGVIKSGHNSAGYPDNFGASDAVTADSLNDHVNDSTFNTTAVDDSTIEVYDSGAKIRVKDDGVTFAKMQNISENKVLGRTTAGSGAVEEVDLLDEDDMNSDSDTAVATQQSIKAYVNSQSTNIANTINKTASVVSVTENIFSDLDGMQVTITPKREDSKFVISGMLSAAFVTINSDYGIKCQYRVNDGAYQDFELPTDIGNRVAIHFEINAHVDNQNQMSVYSYHIILDDPNYDISASDTLTFKLVIAGIDTSVDLYLNRSEVDTDNNDHPRGISTIIVQEF